MNDDLEKFCKNYEICILGDQKVRAKYRPPHFFTDPSCANVVRNDIVNYEQERVYTVEIPEGRLQALVELEQRFFKWQRHSDREVDLFETLIKKEREESYLRQTNPAVQKAYEQYSLLLNLAGYKKEI